MSEFVVHLDDPDDPRLADYRQLKEHRLNEDSGKFVAESELIVRKLLGSTLRIHSILLTETRLRSLHDVMRPGCATYVLPQEGINRVAGFHVHRGCLAVAERPRAACIPDNARLVVVAEDLVDVENLGALARNAAAFGADALILSPRCADPFYRKAIRVSAGGVFFLPIVRLARWPDDIVALCEPSAAGPGFSLVGASLAPGSVPLGEFRAPERVALILGSEGPGLQPETQRLCNTLVTIPMSGGADSLNVAAAGAVILYALGIGLHLTQPKSQPTRRRRRPDSSSG